MGVIHIENVDERTMRSIRLRAARNGRSLEEEVQALLRAAGPPAITPEEFAIEVERIRAMTPKGVKQTDSTEIIRELREMQAMTPKGVDV